MDPVLPQDTAADCEFKSQEHKPWCFQTEETHASNAIAGKV